MEAIRKLDSFDRYPHCKHIANEAIPIKLKLVKALHAYIKAFEKKHDLKFDSAVADDLMGVLDFGSTDFFSMCDIIEDIDNDYPKGLIKQWQEDCIQNHPKYINLKSYVMGLRYEMI